MPHRPVAARCQPAAPLIVAEGLPPFDVEKTLGHSTFAVTTRYARFSLAAGRAGIDKLGRALGGGVPGESPAEPLATGSGVAEGVATYVSRRSA